MNSPAEPDRDVRGQTTAITTISAVKPWGGLWLPVLFQVVKRVPSSTKRLRDLSFIDFARWCLIKELPYNGPPQRKGKLRYKYLFFESNFNGGWEEYIDAFFNLLNGGMRAFWKSSYGFPKPFRLEPFKQYIKRNEYEVDHYYVAYDASSTAIQRALALAGTPSTPVTPFMTMTPIKPGARDALLGYLRAMDPGPLANLPRTHMGRFVVIDDFRHDSEWNQPDEEHLGLSYLIFTVCHDGPTDTYLDELCSSFDAKQIWGSCVGAPFDIKRYLLHNEVKAGVFFDAYAATVQQVKYAIEKYPDVNENWVSKTPIVRLHVGRAVEIVLDTYKRDRAKCPTGSLAKRDQHAEEYGTVHGRMTICADDIAPELRYGLFAQDGSYDVVSRLSPNKRTHWPICPPVGMALKIHDVSTDHGLVDQDFIVASNTDRFFCRNAEEGVELVKARANGLPGFTSFIFPSINPRKWRLLELRILTQTMKQRVEDLLTDTRYFSQTPVMCGPHIVKLLVLTAPGTTRRLSLRRPDLSMRLRESLRDSSKTVELHLQLMTDEDDPNDARKSSHGAWQKVATIFFPAQEVGNGEGLSFNVRRGHPAHEPFGEINELRGAVYEAVFHERSTENADRRA